MGGDVATAIRHMEISENFLAQAESEFEKGYLLQASEKAWGSVAHYVKSVARERCWPNSSHGDVLKNARKLVRLGSDPDGHGRMLVAMNALHINFYEENLESDDVERAIRDAKVLIAEMRAVSQREETNV